MDARSKELRAAANAGIPQVTGTSEYWSTWPRVVRMTDVSQGMQKSSVGFAFYMLAMPFQTIFLVCHLLVHRRMYLKIFRTDFEIWYRTMGETVGKRRPAQDELDFFRATWLQCWFQVHCCWRHACGKWIRQWRSLMVNPVRVGMIVQLNFDLNLGITSSEIHKT